MNGSIDVGWQSIIPPSASFWREHPVHLPPRRQNGGPTNRTPISTHLHSSSPTSSVSTISASMLTPPLSHSNSRASIGNHELHASEIFLAGGSHRSYTPPSTSLSAEAADVTVKQDTAVRRQGIDRYVSSTSYSWRSTDSSLLPSTGKLILPTMDPSAPTSSPNLPSSSLESFPLGRLCPQCYTFLPAPSNSPALSHLPIPTLFSALPRQGLPIGFIPCTLPSDLLRSPFHLPPLPPSTIPYRDDGEGHNPFDSSVFPAFERFHVQIIYTRDQGGCTPSIHRRQVDPAGVISGIAITIDRGCRSGSGRVDQGARKRVCSLRLSRWSTPSTTRTARDTVGICLSGLHDLPNSIPGLD